MTGDQGDQVDDDRRGGRRGAGGCVGQHGETGWLDKVYLLTVDGLIYAASMVLLNDARGLTPHWLACGALGLGISTTLAVNVAAGLAYSGVGASVAAWPAPALVISYELVMLIFRRSAAPAPAAGTPAPPEPPAELNGHAAHAAELSGVDGAHGHASGRMTTRAATGPTAAKTLTL